MLQVTGLTLGNTGYVPSTGHVSFAVEKAALGRGFPRGRRTSLSIIMSPMVRTHYHPGDGLRAMIGAAFPQIVFSIHPGCKKESVIGPD
jgi:hypothetical protein